MRNLILNRIEEIRIKENNFSKTTMRWWLFTCGKDKTHISEFDFNQCTDEELNEIYERIIKCVYKQM